MFTWSLIDLTGLFLFFFAYRFLYVYIKKKELPLWQTLVVLVLLLPTIVTTLLGKNLTGFDAVICESIENELVTLYPYFVQAIFLLGALVLGFNEQKKIDQKEHRAEIVLATLGITIFLLFFFSSTLLASLLANFAVVEYAYNFGIYGLFGMPILLIFLGYLIVRYQAFDIKVFGAQAIVITLVILDAAGIFFSSSRSELVVNVVTALIVVLFGSFLIRSVKKEIEGRERNEELAKELAKTNTRLRELDRQKSEFVSIASHQLRSPLTSIRGYTSMLMEGSFGKLPQKAVDTLGRILESSSYMALSIEDFLNVSRIEQGRMKYENTNVDVCDMAKKVAEEMQQAALKKGLVLLFRSEAKGSTVAHVDPGKTRQVIYNLIDNALKYTPKGSIDVVVRSEMGDKKMSIDIRDTGVGISKETMGRLFDKFVRARNANSVNVSGTDLGLYVAKQMIEAMGGKITIASEGEGKGSTFTIELPLA
ncbi:HAMP domain-containing histidine kinase [Patescibacteria group bacterium]|nr:HAMP domain-containing histidine kinase [Patescibacteria group bacterium]